MSVHPYNMQYYAGGDLSSSSDIADLSTHYNNYDTIGTSVCVFHILWSGYLIIIEQIGQEMLCWIAARGMPLIVW